MDCCSDAYNGPGFEPSSGNIFFWPAWVRGQPSPINERLNFQLCLGRKETGLPVQWPGISEGQAPHTTVCWDYLCNRFWEPCLSLALLLTLFHLCTTCIFTSTELRLLCPGRQADDPHQIPQIHGQCELSSHCPIFVVVAHCTNKWLYIRNVYFYVALSIWVFLCLAEYFYVSLSVWVFLCSPDHLSIFM